MKKVYDFGDTIVDLDSIVMVKSYPDNTVAITFTGNDRAYRFGPLDDKEYQEFMDQWVGGVEE